MKKPIRRPRRSKRTTELLKRERALLAEKQRLLKQGNFTREVMEASGPDATGDLSSHRTHTADQGTESYQSELASRHKSVESRTLREIDDALRRVADGTYGTCASCGRAIPKARLEIVPHARLCVTCSDKLGR
jgi:RNA polymerase-binding transcription factor DksA